MAEAIQTRRTEELGDGPGGLDDIFSQTGGSHMATVTQGLHDEELPVAGMTVGEIRRRYGDRFDIDPRSQAQLDAVDVSDDVVVQTGQQLSFARHIGEKGAGDRGLSSSCLSLIPQP